MKSYPYYQSLFLSTAIAIMPFAGKATVFFNDTFNNGSTLTNGTAAPTLNSTAYQLSSSKNWLPNPPVLAANDLKFGIASTTSGGNELQALFTANPVSLVAPGDYVRMTITFTNGGLLTASALLGFGLYNGSQVQPVAGGLFGTATSGSADHVTGGVQNWQGYWGQRAFSGNSRIVLRLPQTAGPDNRNQNLTSSGSGSLSYGSPAAATIGANNSTVSGPMDTNGVYTVVLAIALTDVNTLSITNYYYNGPNTNGTEVCEFGASASGTSYTGSTFDGLAVGWRATGTNATGTALDISSITVDGSVTVISAPPTITQEPVDVSVGTGGSVPFTVAADGVNVTYQWFRNGTKLSNVGNISGATSSTLVVNNAGVGDAFSGSSGYYVIVSGAGNFSTNSTTNSLTLVAPKNLVWNGVGSDWDLNTSPNWNDGANAATFNYGDSVTFDDTGSGNSLVNLNGNFLSASKWVVAGTTSYGFSGSGHFAGTGPLIFNSGAGGTIQLSVVNTHTGGTIVSNSNPLLDIYCAQYSVLGNGLLTLAKPGIMEFAVAGSATVGVPQDIAVNDNFTLQFDGTGTFAGVMLGNLTGPSGKTLTLSPLNPAGNNRFRNYGPSTIYSGNVSINPNGNPTASVAQYDGSVMAPYQPSPGTQTYNGVISGNGGLSQRGTGTTILNGANTYTGGTTPTTGAIGIGNDAALGTGVLNIAPETGSASGSGTIFASGGAHTIANTLQYPDSTTNQTLIIGGTNAITFSGTFNLNGADGSANPTNRILQVTNTAATTFSGVISDNGNNDGINKTGNGALYLNGANTYLGTNNVSAGRLAGSGTVAGTVVVQTNAAIGGGSAASIGTLSVGGDLTLNNGGNVFIRVNKSLAQSNDMVSVTGALAHTGIGTITVTNIGGTILAAGDKFQIFNKAVTGGNTLTITGAGLNWTNNLAVDGSISAGTVLSTVATNPTNMTFSVSGTNINITWPTDHQGWYLQMNTNNLTNSTSWVDVPGSNAGTNSLVPINPAASKAFFRMALEPF